MVLVKTRAQRMGEGMHTAQAFLEGNSGHGRRHEHAFAGQQVPAIGVGRGQMVLDQAHAFHCDPGGHRVIQRRAERFDVVGEGVHARRSGKRRRQAPGQDRVENDRGRQ